MVVLVLSGGNALGAYQAGAWQALEERGVAVDWVIGGSTGAANGVILCGNPPERRLDALTAYWQPSVTVDAAAAPFGKAAEDWRRTFAAQMGMMAGAPHIFTPRRLFGPFWEPFGNREPSSFYDTTPLGETMERLVDFDRLNDGSIRFSATAVDIETGEDVVFDTRTHRIGVAHVRASAALPPLFPPVEVDGRLLADAGASANLPIDGVLEAPPPGPVLCIAIDLLPLRAPRPATLGNVAERMQDLIFSAQARRAIQAWRRVYDLQPDRGAVTLVHLAYARQEPEVCGKAFDFSPDSIAYRWDQGRTDMARVLDSVAAGIIRTGDRGLTVHRFA